MKLIAEKYKLVGTSGKDLIQSASGRWINVNTLSVSEADQLFKEGFQYLVPATDQEIASAEKPAALLPATDGGEKQKLIAKSKQQLFKIASESGIGEDALEGLKKEEIVDAILNA